MDVSHRALEPLSDNFGRYQGRLFPFLDRAANSDCASFTNIQHPTLAGEQGNISKRIFDFVKAPAAMCLV